MDSTARHDGPAIRLAVLAWLLAFAFFSRAWAFGDPFQEDEQLFLAIGGRMLEGEFLYVDMWDRKPPGLFAFYAGLAALGTTALTYQIAGALSVALTGFVIAAIVRREADWPTGALAGTLYAAAILQFSGAGGQAAIFYNLFMALAALLVLGDGDRKATTRRAIMAMLLAGLAITFKQTAVFEGVFFGLFVLWRARSDGRSAGGMVRQAIALALAGAAPMLAFAAVFAAVGHFYALWATLVDANLAKAYDPGGDWGARLSLFTTQLGPLILLAAIGLVFSWRERNGDRGFLTLWLLAAVIGFLAVPNLIDHYVLPLIMVLCVAAGGFLRRRPLGTLAGIAIVILYLTRVPVLDFGQGWRSEAQLSALVERIERDDPEPRVLVFDGPVALYARTGHYPPSPLFFPLHTNYAPEDDVSQFDTGEEFTRMLAARPTTIVMLRREGADLYNQETLRMVTGYIAQNCSGRFAQPIADRHGEQALDVHTGCAD